MAKNHKWLWTVAAFCAIAYTFYKRKPGTAAYNIVNDWGNW